MKVDPEALATVTAKIASSMQAEFEKIAECIGELCGAARHDWSTASYEDVGLHGVPIKTWREAYFEGCKDMAEAVASQLPPNVIGPFKEITRAAFEKAFSAASAEAPAQS